MPQGALVSPAIPAGGEAKQACSAEMGGFSGSGMKWVANNKDREDLSVVEPTKQQSYGQWADKTRQVVKSEDVEDDEDEMLC